MNTHLYSLEDYNFAQLARHCHCAKEKQRYLILANAQDGKPLSSIADSFKVSLSTVNRTLRRFRESGISDLKDRPRSGAPTKLPFPPS